MDLEHYKENERVREERNGLQSENLERSEEEETMTKWVIFICKDDLHQ